MRKNRLAEVIGTLYPGIQGALPVITDNGSMPDQISLINALLAVNPWPATAFNTYAGTGAVTLTQSQVMAAESTVLAVTTLSAGAALTLPTAAVMLATMTASQGVIGSSTTLRILNTSGFTATMTTAAGWTLNGTMTVATESFRDFFVTISGVGAGAAFVLQDVGAGAVAAE